MTWPNVHLTFFSFPILANCCCLDGMSPPSGNQSWPERVTQLLKELSSDILLEAVVVSHDKSPPALKLTLVMDKI